MSSSPQDLSPLPQATPSRTAETSTSSSAPPPTRQEISANSSFALSWIQARTLKLYSSDRISHQQQPAQDTSPLLDRAAYLDMYNTVHNYGAVSMTQQDRGRPKHHDPEAGQKLYDFLEQTIQSHCRAIRSYLESSIPSSPRDTQPDTALLREYLEQWKAFENLSRVVTNVYRTFDRHWVKRETDERRSMREEWWKEESVRRRERLGRQGEEMPDLVWPIGELHARGWRREVLGLRGNNDGNAEESEDEWVTIAEIVKGALLRGQGGSMQDDGEKRLLDEVGESCRKVAVGSRKGKLVVL